MPPYGPAQPGGPGAIAFTGRSAAAAADAAAASKDAIIRDLFAAYLRNDRKAVEATFTDDFRFTSPYDAEIDKATSFDRCWRVSDGIARQDLERIMIEGEAAFEVRR